MAKRTGTITAITGNMISVRFSGDIIQNEVGYVVAKDRRLKSEVIRIRGRVAEAQVYENTASLRVGDEVEFTDDLLSVERRHRAVNPPAVRVRSEGAA